MNEFRPTLSLIKYLEKDRSGFVLDLDPPTGARPRRFMPPPGRGPYAKSLRAAIVTDAGDRVQEVLLIVQRDSYDPVDALMVRPTNPTLDAAWEAAVAAHCQPPEASASVIRLSGQNGHDGRCLPFQSLFYCDKARRWFHPVCPQCGLELALCQDDTLLARWGLGTYTGSLDRFMHCPSCSSRDAVPAFYVREKTADWPACVQDAADLIRHWQAGDAMPPGKSGLPCVACPHRQGCAGDPAAAIEQIRPFAFYPFHVLMVPAPSCSAEAFLRALGGDDSVGTAVTGREDLLHGQHFLFRGQERWFLEVLYLKLTFLDQVCRGFLPAAVAAPGFDMALGLDGIGVDITPGGAGLPAFWNFRVRLLDAVGTARQAPFAPRIPESPRYYFLGSLWFRTLLVNAAQGADTVFDRVGAWIGPLRYDDPVEALSMEAAEPTDPLAPGQIFWNPDPHVLPPHWQAHWTQALTLGAQLVHAGLKSGAVVDPQTVLGGLETLRQAVKQEMFAAAHVAAGTDRPEMAADRLRGLLQRVLDRWERSVDAADLPLPGKPAPPAPRFSDETILIAPLTAGATLAPERTATPATRMPDEPAVPLPSADSTGERGMDETVVFSPSDRPPPAPPIQTADFPDRRPMPPADPDNAATVLLPRGGNSRASGIGNGDTGDKTVLLTPPAGPAARPPQHLDERMTATVHPRANGPMATGGSEDDDLAATVLLRTNGAAPPPPSTPGADDDLAATLIQGADRTPIVHPAEGPDHDVDRAPNPPPDDLAETLMISPRGGAPSAAQPCPPSPSAPEADDLAETLIATPRQTDPRSTIAGPPPPPPATPAPLAERKIPEKFPSEADEDDDTVMEQTVIIRSDVRNGRKE